MENTAISVSVQRIHRLKDAGNLKAFVDILLNEVILIKGLRIIYGSKGLFVAMPSEQSAKDQKWYDTVRCLNQTLEQQIATEVLAVYQQS